MTKKEDKTIVEDNSTIKENPIVEETSAIEETQTVDNNNEEDSDIQTTFNDDELNDIVEEGAVENVYSENN